ncbi:MAG: hypothetical protein IPM77_06490 [Crocinitomicaceae bacterium]|nr:hypothetical protein [Crocinitomicaceae bacterium]
MTTSPQDYDQNYLPGQLPFADPKVFTDNGSIDRFIVEPGTEVNFTAGEAIVLKPGTYILNGSKFKAEIEPFCSNMHAPENYGAESYKYSNR